MSTATKERKRARPASSVTVTRSALHSALGHVAGAVPTRSPKPILSNVLLDGGMLTATDLELRISTPLPGSDGLTMLLPHQRLASIVNSLHPTVEVTITPDGTSAVIQASGGTWRLPVEDHLEYPRGEEVDPTWIAHLPADQFLALMGSVKFATDNESSRYAIGGVLIEWERTEEGGMLTFVGTDGRRMCVSQAEVSQATDDAKVIVPRDAVDSLCKLAKGAQLVQLGYAGNQLVAEIDDNRVHAVLVQGNFPPWTDAEPTRTVTPSLVIVGSLLSACRQAAICESEASRGVTFAFTKEGLHLTSRSAEAGEASVTCDLVEAGHACNVKLDPRFVCEWLSCGSFDWAETIEVEAEDAQSAVVLRAQDARCVIMPLAKD
jgi:DNA polymerase-3 subunit beta